MKRQRSFRLLSPHLTVTVTLIVLIAGGVFAYILIPRMQGTTPTNDYVAAQAPAAGDPNAPDPALERLYKADNQIVSEAARVMKKDPSSGPRLITVKLSSGPRSVLVVPGSKSSPQTYELSQLANRVPAAIALDTSGTATLKLPTVVGDGVRLVIDAKSTPVVRLASSPYEHASLTGMEGQIVLRGTSAKKLSITSVATATSQPDQDEHDGRPFIRTKGGRLEVRNTQVSDLGYYIGETSGLSWMAGSGAKATGGAWDSIFARNHFGAYSSQARGLQIIRTSFLDNRYYGFDPHTDTTHTVIRDSRASGNGRHGIIFSKGCNDNVVESTSSTGNGGAGFMIDDGNPNLGDTRTSNRNQLRSIVASNNGGPGVVIEGGSDNTVHEATLTNNRIGYWARTNATRSRLERATIDASLQAAVRIDGDSASTSVEGLTVDGAQTGLWIGSSRDSVISHADLLVRGTGIRQAPDATGVQLTDVVIEGSGPHAITDADSAESTLAGVTVVNWKTVHSQSFVSELIEFVLHPLMIITWSIILVPPTLAAISRSRRKTMRH